jgi:putative transposase
MVNYRRNRLDGGVYFFTATLRDRRSDLLTREIEALRTSWKRAADRVPHRIIVAVVLPEHLHVLIEMRDNEDDYPRLWQEIKKGFTRRVDSARSPWQPRYWEHTIRDDADWPHSSIHRYIERGDLPRDWGMGTPFSGDFGEPIGG